MRWVAVLAIALFAAPNDWIIPTPAGRLLANRLPRAKLLAAPVGDAAMIDERVNVANWLDNGDYWPALS